MASLLYPPTQNGLQKSLSAQLDEGTTASMTLNNTTGVQNLPGVVVINRIDSNGDEKDAALREYVTYTGTSGSTLTGLARGKGGSTDQDHAVGSVVEFIPDVTVFQSIQDALSAVVVVATGLVDTTKVVTPTGTQTLTNKTLTTPTIDTISSTRINPRVGTVADAATITPTGDTVDMYTVTALAQAATIAAPTGTPVSGQKLILRFLDNGTARALTWNSIYVSRGATLPTTTTLSKYTYVGLIYNSTASKWDCIAAVTEA